MGLPFLLYTLGITGPLGKFYPVATVGTFSSADRLTLFLALPEAMIYWPMPEPLLFCWCCMNLAFRLAMICWSKPLPPSIGGPA